MIIIQTILTNPKLIMALYSTTLIENLKSQNKKRCTACKISTEVIYECVPTSSVRRKTLYFCTNDLHLLNTISPKCLVRSDQESCDKCGWGSTYYKIYTPLTKKFSIAFCEDCAQKVLLREQY